MNLQKIITNDGSHSLLVKEMNETYHSRNGALAEANHVFIKHGLNHLISEEKTKINVLEIGFGTGLNAFLTALNAREKNLQIC